MTSPSPRTVARPSTLYLDVKGGAIHVGGDVIELGRGTLTP